MTTVQVVETSVTVNNTPISVVDPDLQIRGGPPAPQNFFLALRPHFGLKMGGGGGGGVGRVPGPPLDPPLYLELL